MPTGKEIGINHPKGEPELEVEEAPSRGSRVDIRWNDPREMGCRSTDDAIRAVAVLCRVSENRRAVGYLGRGMPVGRMKDLRQILRNGLHRVADGHHLEQFLHICLSHPDTTHAKRPCQPNSECWYRGCRNRAGSIRSNGFPKGSPDRGPLPIGAKIRTFLVKNVLQVVDFPNAIPNMLWGQRLILALMGATTCPVHTR